MGFFDKLFGNKGNEIEDEIPPELKEKVDIAQPLYIYKLRKYAVVSCPKNPPKTIKDFTPISKCKDCEYFAYHSQKGIASPKCRGTIYCLYGRKEKPL